MHLPMIWDIVCHARFEMRIDRKVLTTKRTKGLSSMRIFFVEVISQQNLNVWAAQNADAMRDRDLDHYHSVQIIRYPPPLPLQAHAL